MRKRKRAGDEPNEFLPEGPPDEAANVGSLSFNEILDEKVAFFITILTCTDSDMKRFLDPND
jgi:hypothetical protein